MLVWANPAGMENTAAGVPPVVHATEDASGMKSRAFVASDTAGWRAAGAVVALSAHAASANTTIAESGRGVFRVFMGAESPEVGRSTAALIGRRPQDEVSPQLSLVRPRFGQRSVASVSPFGFGTLAHMSRGVMATRRRAAAGRDARTFASTLAGRNTAFTALNTPLAPDGTGIDGRWTVESPASALPRGQAGGRTDMDFVPHSNRLARALGARYVRGAVAIAIVVLFAAVAPAPRSSAANRDSTATESPGPSRPGSRVMRGAPDTLARTWIEMQNVNLRVAKDAVVGVRRLRGEVIPTQRGSSALLDSTSSFSIRITSGTVALQSADLGVILNRFVFGYKGSPLKNLKVRTEGTQLVQSGVMHKGVDLKFEITAALSLTDSGFIRLHPTKVRVLGVNGESLLHALGLHLDDMLDLSKSAAARVKGVDNHPQPAKIPPPPAIGGRLTSVRVEGDALVQEFARLSDDTLFSGYARPDSAAPNYLF